MIRAAALLLSLPFFSFAQFATQTGVVHLPPGVKTLDAEIQLPEGAHDLTIIGDRTTLRANAKFHGRAILSCIHCRNLTIRNLTLDGNRADLERPQPLPPTDKSFASFYSNNGILVEESDGFSLDRVEFVNIASFAVLVAHSRHVTLSRLSVSDSGSRNGKGRNNTTGGVLLEQGTQDFQVSGSVFRNIRGNGLWTHSCYLSPRNLRGKFLKNDFSEIGRDAIQVGHASEVTVAGNTGRRIGFPASEVDVEGGGTPVAVDTAGNVDRTVYENNDFTEINGKCFDLDGFHDGILRGNKCVNHGPPEDYPYGNFGIAFNNSSIEMESRNVLIENNTLEGMKFGGIFVVGSGHRILGNILRMLNTAHCNETHAKFGCIVTLEEPGFLESGIYLGRRADRPDPSRAITIQGNTISGWKMGANCIRAAPGVNLTDNRIQDNRCTDLQ